MQALDVHNVPSQRSSTHSLSNPHNLCNPSKLSPSSTLLSSSFVLSFSRVLFRNCSLPLLSSLLIKSDRERESERREKSIRVGGNFNVTARPPTTSTAVGHYQLLATRTHFCFCCYCPRVVAVAGSESKQHESVQ